jgi:hypothetical protein
MRSIPHDSITLQAFERQAPMQTKSLLLGTLAGLSIATLSLTLAPSVASARGPKPSAEELLQSVDPTLITADNDNLFIVRYGVVYKVNKLQLAVTARAQLR